MGNIFSCPKSGNGTNNTEENGGKRPRKKSRLKRSPFSMSLLEGNSGIRLPFSSQELSEQQRNLQLKYRIENNVRHSVEQYLLPMTKWIRDHPQNSDVQIQEFHERTKIYPVAAFLSVFRDYLTHGGNPRSSGGQPTPFNITLEGLVKLEGEVNALLPNFLRDPSSTPVALGIYLDETQILVGRNSSGDPREPEVLLKATPEISFLQNRIIVGQPGEDCPLGNHFYLHEVIKAPAGVSSEHSLYFTASPQMSIKKFRITSEEILAIFFEKILEEVKGKGAGEIQDIVLTVPFLLTSYEKARIRRAVLLAGYKNCRIISSPLANALIYAVDTGFYLRQASLEKSVRKEAEPKTILTLQYLEQSFVVTLIHIDPTSIQVGTASGWENLSECQDKTFMHTHRLLFTDEPCDPVQEKAVQNVYEKAIRQLSDQVRLKSVDAVILVKGPRGDTGLDRICRNLFRDKYRVRSVLEGPLAGACLLASRTRNFSFFLPPHVSVGDVSRANLALTSKVKQWQVQFKNRRFKPGPAVEIPLVLPCHGDCEVTLIEEYLGAHVFSVVGKFKVVLVNQEPTASGDCGVKMRLWMDQDGILTTDAEFSGRLTGEGYVRVQDLLRKDPFGRSKDRDKLLGYYKGICGRSQNEGEEFQIELPGEELELGYESDLEKLPRGDSVAPVGGKRFCPEIPGIEPVLRCGATPPEHSSAEESSWSPPPDYSLINVSVGRLPSLPPYSASQESIDSQTFADLQLSVQDPAGLHSQKIPRDGA